MYKSGAHLAGRDFPDDVDIDFMDIRKAEAWQVAPEKELAFFAKNLESITCAIEILNKIRQYSPDLCEKIKRLARKYEDVEFYGKLLKKFR